MSKTVTPITLPPVEPFPTYLTEFFKGMVK